jgi:hypothetical protein
VGKFFSGDRQPRFDGIEHIRYPILSNRAEGKENLPGSLAILLQVAVNVRFFSRRGL